MSAPPASLWSATARAPRAALAVALALTLVLGLLARGVQPRYEVEDFFPAHTAERRDYERDVALFGRDDRVGLVVVEAARPFGPEDLARLHASAARISSLTQVERVRSLTTALVPRKHAERDVRLEPALPPGGGAPSPARLAELLALYALPPYAGTLLSADRCLAVLHVVLRPEHLSYRERAALYDALGLEQARLEGQGYRVRLAGYPLHRVQLVRLSQEETRKLLPLTLGVIVVMGLVAFRSLAGALLPLTVAALAAVWTTGLLRLVGLPPNIFSSAVYVLVAVVGVSSSIHLLARCRELRSAGLAREPAIHQALEEAGPSCGYASLTTALAFASLALTGLPLVAHMGLQIALGVCAALALTLLLLPVAVRLGEPAQVPEREGLLARACVGLDAWAAGRPRALIAAFLALLVAGGVLATRLTVNAPLLADLDPEHPIRVTYRQLEERLGGVIPVDLLLEAPPGRGPDRAAAYSLERMRKVEALTERLRALPEVRWAAGPVDALRRLAPLLRDVAPAEVPGLLPTALLLAEEQVRPWVNVDQDVLRIRLRLADLDSAAALALFARVDALSREVLGEPARLTGQGYLAQAINRDIVAYFRAGFLAALVAVSLVLWLALRDPLLAGASVLPNLFPVVVLAGGMALCGLELRYTTALVLSVVFGLAVDDTIHLLAHLGRQAPGPERLRRTLRRTGAGLVLTSVLLAAGFGVLLFASFLPLRVMGITLAATAALALLADLLLLPALLRVLGRA
ncbi:MAG: RND family transporter [Planctomycetota bacterium]